MNVSFWLGDKEYRLNLVKKEKNEIRVEIGKKVHHVSYELINADDSTVIISGSGTINNADTDAEGNTIKTIQAIIDFTNTDISVGTYYLVFTVIFSTTEKEVFRVSYKVKNYKANY